MKTGFQRVLCGYITALFATAGFLALLLAAGCSSTGSGTPSPNEPLHHFNWWNFYTRGAASMLHDDFVPARADFEVCLNLRRGARFGNTKDSWLVRTYGVHELNGYFPNRELGICMYFQDDLAGAAKYLEKSISDAPSARASFYLNLVRAKLVQKSVTPSHIGVELTGRSPIGLTKEHRVRFAGIAKSDKFINKLAINNRDEYVELADGAVRFSKDIRLHEGTNIVPVTASDLSGARVSSNFEWIADWSPPQMMIRSIAQQGQGWILQGTLSDASGVRVASIDGRPLQQASGGRTVDFQATLSGNGPAILRAEDLVGNQKIITLDPAKWALDQHVSLRGAVQFAQAGTPDTPDVPVIRAAVSKADRSPPVIRLPDIHATNIIDAREFLIDCEVRDDRGIASITVNGISAMGHASTGCLGTTFASYVPLKRGTNSFVVLAADIAGNVAKEAFTVVSREPAYLKDESRMGVALVINASGVVDENVRIASKEVHNSLHKELIESDPRRFQVVNRDNLEPLLVELKLGSSSLAEPLTRLRTGRLLAAELFFVESFEDQGRGTSFIVEVTDSETGLPVRKKDVYVDSRPANTGDMARMMALKISQEFPFVEGKITAVRGKRIELDVGSSHGVDETISRFLVLAKDIHGNDDSMRFNEKLIQAKISEAKDEHSSATIYPAEAMSIIKVGQTVYSR